MDKTHDYYAILGVAKDATPEMITNQFRKLIKENHPDQYNGLKAKYKEDQDVLLMKLLEEKIKAAEEFCKVLNEANGVLSDPFKRKRYDELLGDPEDNQKVDPPKISISPKSIFFGTLKKGDKKTSVFTISNDGGPAAAVAIDWKGDKPSWGDFLIELDENATFPIKVTVTVDTTGLPMCTVERKIEVTVDGKVFVVNVSFAIPGVVPVRPARRTPPPRPTPTPASAAPKPAPDPVSPKPAPAPDPVPPAPPVVPPVIVISQSNIDFGIIEKGKRQTAAFTIENKGGPVTGVDLCWKGTKPDWAQLIVEPDKVNTFPIQVYILVDTSVNLVGNELKDVIEVNCQY